MYHYVLSCVNEPMVETAGSEQRDLDYAEIMPRLYCKEKQFVHKKELHPPYPDIFTSNAMLMKTGTV